MFFALHPINGGFSCFCTEALKIFSAILRTLVRTEPWSTTGILSDQPNLQRAF